MPREEGDKLLSALLPFAEQMLAKHGTFHPFGAFLDPKGEVCLLGAHDGRENPSSVELIDLMVTSMKKEAPEKGYLAVGICFDVMILLPNTTQKTDAIQVAIEYADGEAVDVYLPYKKKWFGKIQYGNLSASRSEPKIFTKAQ